MSYRGYYHRLPKDWRPRWDGLGNEPLTGGCSYCHDKGTVGLILPVLGESRIIKICRGCISAAQNKAQLVERWGDIVTDEELE